MDSNIWSIEKQLLKPFRRCSVGKYLGRVTTEGTTVRITTEHCHPANEAKLEAKRFKIMLISKAKESTAPIPKLYNEMLHLETENVSNEEVISNFQTLPSMKTSLYRARPERLPVMPSARDDMSIEREWAVTSNGKRILLSSDGSENKIS